MKTKNPSSAWISKLKAGVESSSTILLPEPKRQPVHQENAQGLGCQNVNLLLDNAESHMRPPLPEMYSSALIRKASSKPCSHFEPEHIVKVNFPLYFVLGPCYSIFFTEGECASEAKNIRYFVRWFSGRR